MANIVIKKNFVDGDKLFAQQLNNNFETIEKGINDGNKIVWQDGTEVKFKRYVTNDIDSLPILDGSIIYDTEKGRHYIDYQGKRVQVGSAGKEVLVQEEQPTEEDNKIWIDSDFVNTMGTEVVNSLDGNETNMAPSVNAINKLITYSEEEQIIGTYLGKPLYRKVITGNIADGTTLVSNVDVLVDAKGTGDLNEIYRTIPYYEVWDSKVYALMVNKNLSNEVKTVAFKYGEATTAKNCNIVLEYTKATDSEVI